MAGKKLRPACAQKYATAASPDARNAAGLVRRPSTIRVPQISSTTPPHHGRLPEATFTNIGAGGTWRNFPVPLCRYTSPIMMRITLSTRDCISGPTMWSTAQAPSRTLKSHSVRGVSRVRNTVVRRLKLDQQVDAAGELGAAAHRAEPELLASVVVRSHKRLSRLLGDGGADVRPEHHCPDRQSSNRCSNQQEESLDCTVPSREMTFVHGTPPRRTTKVDRC